MKKSHVKNGLHFGVSEVGLDDVKSGVNERHCAGSLAGHPLAMLPWKLKKNKRCVILILSSLNCQFQLRVGGSSKASSRPMQLALGLTTTAQKTFINQLRSMRTVFKEAFRIKLRLPFIAKLLTKPPQTLQYFCIILLYLDLVLLKMNTVCENYSQFSLS